jgi:RNA polymerase sigma-70 factor (ECF subfamily)
MEESTTDIKTSLLERIKKGDNKAFKELYSRYSKAMYNISFRIVNNRDEAEDVLQESFLKALQNLEKFENESAFGGWLKRVVMNRSIDAVRQRKISFVSLEEHAEQLEDEEKEPVYTAEILRECILQLPDNYRVILSLFLFEKQSHKDIGTMLNISEGTSKSQYHRAKKKLIKLIREKNHDH